METIKETKEEDLYVTPLKEVKTEDDISVKSPVFDLSDDDDFDPTSSNTASTLPFVTDPFQMIRVGISAGTRCSRLRDFNSVTEFLIIGNDVKKLAKAIYYGFNCPLVYSIPFFVELSVGEKTFALERFDDFRTFVYNTFIQDIKEAWTVDGVTKGMDKWTTVKIFHDRPVARRFYITIEEEMLGGKGRNDTMRVYPFNLNKCIKECVCDFWHSEDLKHNTIGLPFRVLTCKELTELGLPLPCDCGFIKGQSCCDHTHS